MILHAVTIHNHLARDVSVFIKDARRWPRRGAGAFFVVHASDTVNADFPKPLRFRNCPTIEADAGVEVTLDLRDDPS